MSLSLTWTFLASSNIVAKHLNFAYKVAVTHAGNLQIELIESKTTKSAYRDVVAEGCSGFHHVCVSTEDFEADRKYFEALG